ncbi:hypothetical protein WMY93_031037, partial [Mugilogobius chulae]
MGKEQELLEAARTGNLAAVEKLLSGKRQSAGASGGSSGTGGSGNSGGGTSSSHTLSSLLSIWRGPNVNCVDSTGYTPLHHAALNGHSEVVEALLRNEALTNIADNKGCYPLHLAAWKGDQQIVRLLIHQGPSHPKLNEQNNDNETPLHCAAQYGHTQVVRLLLEELTDPTMRNNKFETPLDLAALYGRLEVVRLLLSAHPNLLSCNTKKHTPLHLASRNGHLPVVEVLLDAGMDINYETEKGSALHEAALFGKTDVVQKLLMAGIDVNMVDQKGLTALDIVKDMPSQKSREIAALIQGHMSGKPPDIDLPPPPIPPPQETPSPRKTNDSTNTLHSSNNVLPQIEKIMTLIGAGIDFSRDQQYATPGAGRLLEQPVGDWLEHVGLPQYESKLLLNGFDDLHYMGSNVMEDQDLREIGITDASHRKKILHAARSFPKVKAFGCDGSCSLSSWLENLGLHEYLPNFLSSGYRTLDCVKNLWELEIVNVLKITLLGHRKRIIASLAERPYEEPPVKPPRLSQIRCLDLPGSQSSSPLSQMDLYTGHSMDPLLPTGERKKSLDADYEVPQRHRQRTQVLAAPYAPVQNWHHQPEKLIFDLVPMKPYLGSMLIKDLRGTESTQDACAKMRSMFHTVSFSIVHTPLNCSSQCVLSFFTVVRSETCQYAAGVSHNANNHIFGEHLLDGNRTL